VGDVADRHLGDAEADDKETPVASDTLISNPTTS